MHENPNKTSQTTTTTKYKKKDENELERTLESHKNILIDIEYPRYMKLSRNLSTPSRIGRFYRESLKMNTDSTY